MFRKTSIIGLALAFVALVSLGDFLILFNWSNHWYATLPWHSFATKSKIIMSLMHWEMIVQIGAIVAWFSSFTIILTESR